MSTDYGEKLREYLAKGYLREIVNFGSLPVFSNASTYPAIFIISKSPAKEFLYKTISARKQLSLYGIENSETKVIQSETLGKSAWSFSAFSLIDHLKRNKISYVPLSDVGHFYIGALTGMDNVFVLDPEKILKEKIERQVLLPYAYRGAEITPFGKVMPSANIIYPYFPTKEGDSALMDETILKEKYPNTFQYLLRFKERLKKRMDSRKFYAKGNKWFCYLRPGRWNYITAEKLLIRGVAKVTCVGYLEKNTAFNGANVPALIIDKLDPKAMMGLLNSTLIAHYLRSVCPPKLQGYRRFNANSLNRIPIPNGREDIFSKIAVLSEELMGSISVKVSTRIPFEIERLERQIQNTKGEIDELVFNLYSLTDRDKSTVLDEFRTDVSK